ncbi:MAG: GGDEF domain-containing protein [Pseudomonadota bacterium]
MPKDVGYDAAMRMAVETFDMMQQYKTPPVPEAYEIFYAYACRKPLEIIERIDEAASTNGILDLHQIYGIHCDLFSYPEALREHQEATNEKLDSELSDVLEMVESHLKRNADYSSSLDSANDDLTTSTSPQALRRTIEKLLSENEKSREESRKLADSLETSQSSIREMREQLAKAREAGFQDALTRLHNRRHFDSQLPKEIAAAQDTQSVLSLVMVDVDHFKSVNDNFGHPAGDAVLRVLGKMLADNVKGRDIPVRYGGEEFSIILPDTSANGAKALANKIRRQLERKKMVLRDTNQDLGKITASFGVAELRLDDNVSSLIARADKMLYEAKHTGRNKVVSDGG